MKMATFQGLFWGIALIILGAGLMARYMYNIQFPVFRILVAFMFIYVGMWFLLRPRFDTGSNLILFSEGRFQYHEKQKEYNIIFGSGELDLRNSDRTANHKIELNCIFGDARIRLNNDDNFIIKSNTAFGNTTFPRGGSNSFGSNTYRSPSFNAEAPHLKIETNAVFGSVRVFVD